MTVVIFLPAATPYRAFGLEVQTGVAFESAWQGGVLHFGAGRALLRKHGYGKTSSLESPNTLEALANGVLAPNVIGPVQGVITLPFDSALNERAVSELTKNWQFYRASVSPGHVPVTNWGAERTTLEGLYEAAEGPRYPVLYLPDVVRNSTGLAADNVQVILSPRRQVYGHLTTPLEWQQVSGDDPSGEDVVATAPITLELQP